MELQTMPLKFRVWDKEEKNWIDAHKDFYIDPYGEVIYDGVVYYGQWEKRFEISQATRLKDKNGEELWTGDIVEINKEVAEMFEMDSNIGVIAYHRGCLMVSDKNEYCSGLANLSMLADINGVLRGKKLGNLWQNSELLEEK